MIMLNNSCYKLHHQKDFTVGYFGGSITCGACASNAEFSSWRGLSKAWLRENFPDVRVHELYAALGGTGTDLGVFRCDHDVCEQNPDLLFVEFATNDGGRNYDRILAHMEAIIRKIRTANPTCDIVMVYTATGPSSDTLALGKDYISRSAHAAVAYHYGVPQVDFGETLRCEVMKRGGDWHTLTRDTVHPTDEGHKVYFDVLKRMVLEPLKGNPAPALKLHSMPAPIVEENPLLRATLIDACLAERSKEWTPCAETMIDCYPHYLESDTPGAWLKLTFTGTQVGGFWMKTPDTGVIDFRVDGGEWTKMVVWDQFSTVVPRGHSSMFAEGLPLGIHTLELKIRDEIFPGSKGKRLCIGAFMVC